MTELGMAGFRHRTLAPDDPLVCSVCAATLGTVRLTEHPEVLERVYADHAGECLTRLRHQRAHRTSDGPCPECPAPPATYVRCVIGECRNPADPEDLICDAHQASGGAALPDAEEPSAQPIPRPVPVYCGFQYPHQPHLYDDGGRELVSCEGQPSTPSPAPGTVTDTPNPAT